MPGPLLARIPLVRPTLPGRTSRLRRRTARGAVLWGLAAFLGVQLGVGVAAEFSLRLRDPLYGDKFAKLERRRATVGSDATTVVMLGSSRTGLAFHGQRAEAILKADLDRPVVAFNYGVPASGPVTHLIYLKRLLESGVKPDFLLLEILPSMIADGHGGPVERHWFYADRVRFSEVDTLIDHGFDASTVRDRHLRSVLIPGYTLRFQLLTRVIPSWLPWQVRFDWSRGADACGWGTTQTQVISPEAREDGIWRARAEYAPILATYRPGGPAVGALRELLTLCREREIPVRLVLMPEGPEFRSWFPPERVERLKSFLAEVAAEYDAPVIDGRDWLPEEAFYDSHHMLAAGAEAFTDRVIRETVTPALQSKEAR